MTQSPLSPLAKLLAAPVRSGSLVWIGLRPERQAPLLTPSSARLIAARGIDGDRYETRHDGDRQATLVSVESLKAIASFLGRQEIPPALLRRNLVTEGINLVALKGRRFRIGTALLEYTGDCAPCSRMEETLGPGGYNAVRGHGGITARIIESGNVRLGDRVERVE